MTDRNPTPNVSALNPKQPEFVIAAADYEKKVVMKYNLSHFYQFTTTKYNRINVIPDACIDILFWKKDGQLKTKIAGTRLERGSSDIEKNTEYFGVRFMPGTNPADDSISLTELVNHEECFEDMIVCHDEKEQLLEGMYCTDSFEDKIHIFMDYYSKHYNENRKAGNPLKNAICCKILCSDGSLKLSDLSAFTGYSDRYLNKTIHREFGVNPKNLIKMIRFQKTIGNLTDSLRDIHYIDTALDLGYYDQSHFNKEFKKITGFTPTHYVDHLLINAYDEKLHIQY